MPGPGMLEREKGHRHANSQKEHCSLCSDLSYAYLHYNNIQTMHWLLLSPGLNPMEQVWVFLKEQTGQLLNWPMNTVQLHQEIKCQWNLLPEAFCHCQISSMPATGVSWSWTVLVAIKLWKTHSRLLLSIRHNSAFLWFCTTFMLTSIFKIVL